jgi:hypothetical protein
MPWTPRPKPFRSFPNSNTVHGIRLIVSMASANGGQALPLGKSIPIGTLPPGAFLLPAQLLVSTLFNGTSPALIIGWDLDDDGILTAASSAVGTAGFKPNLVTGAAYPLARFTSETILYAKLTGTGVTAGEADFMLPFYPAAD